MFSDSMILGGGRKAAFSIANSVRLDGVADYFTRTPAVAGNQKTWTFSVWFKPANLGNSNPLLGVSNNGTTYAQISFDGTTGHLSVLGVVSASTEYFIVTTAQFRDPTAWYHVLVAVDTTQATAANRMKVYINGGQITSFSSTIYPALNSDTLINSTIEHRVGWLATPTSYRLDGYLASPILIDGAALDPTSFGETDPVTGSWRPKRYVGPGNLPVYGVDVTAGKTVSLSPDLVIDGTNLAPFAIDDNPSTKIATNNAFTANTSRIIIDLGAGGDKVIGRITTNQESNYIWTAGKLQYSDDGTSWSDAGLFNPSNSTSTQIFDFPDSGAHRYWALMPAANAYGGSGYGLRFNEIELVELRGSASNFGTNGFHLDFSNPDDLGLDVSRGKLVAVTVPIGNMTANGGLAAAFDGVTDHAAPACATFAPGSGSTSPGWIGAHVGAGADITAVRVHASSNDGFVALVGRVAVLELWGNNVDDTGTASKIADLGSAPDAVGLVITKNGLSVDRDVYPYLWVKIYTSEIVAASKYAAEVQFVTGGDAPNTFTAVSLGAADVVTDTPTNNVATWNPLDMVGLPLASGGRTINGIYATPGNVRASMAVSSGKWYWEVRTGNGEPLVGILDATAGIASQNTLLSFAKGYSYSSEGNKRNNGTMTAYGSAWTDTIIGVALDLDAGTLGFYNGGIFQGVAFNGLTGEFLPALSRSGHVGNFDNCTVNFGQVPFIHTPPAGFKSLCTANLPKPVIQAPAKHMDVVTYSGNADSSGGIWSPIVTDVTTAPGPISYIVGQNGDYLYVYQANNAYGTQAAFTVWRKNADGTFTQTSSLSMPAGFSRGCVVLNTTQTGGSGFYGYISNGDAIGRVVTFTFSHTGGGSIVASDNIGYATYPDGLLKLSNNLIAMNTGYSGGLHICFAIDANLAISKTNSVTGTLGINNGWASEMHKLSATSYLVAYKSSSTTNVGVVSCSGNTLTVTSIAQVFSYLTADTKIIKLDDGRFWIHDSTNDYSAVINVVENTVNVVVSQFQQNVFGGLDFGLSWAYCDYNSWKKVGPDHWLIPACHDNSGPNAQTLAILDLQIDAATGTATALWQSPLTAPVSSRGTFWGGVYGDDVVASFSNDLYYYENAFSVGEWGPDSRTQVVSGLDFQPDLVWIKSRNGAADHAVYDSLRGARNRLETSNSDAEAGNDTGLTAFTGNGFSLGDLAQVNTSGTDYVAWCWKAGGAPVANAEGSVASQVSVNPTAGFSIVTAATLTSNVHTIGHGLGRAPAFVIWKMRNSANDWGVYHVGPGATKAALLNSSLAFSTSSAWDNTSPSASVLTVSGWGAGDYVAYCWAEVPGFSKFGSYTGNGSIDGPFVYCGFRPRWVLVKKTSDVGSWLLFDTARDPYNPAGSLLYPNLSNAEVPDLFLDTTANGLKVRNSTTGFNVSGGTYIFAAFAEAPLGGAKTVPAKAR